MSKPQAPITIPKTFLISSFIITIALTFSFLKTGLENHEQDKTLLELKGLVGRLGEKIIYLDEVLTMSARLAATTGDLTWEDRYKRNEPVLIETINQVKSLSSSLVIQLFIEQTEGSNKKLMTMETQAFLAIHKGQSDLAKTILFGESYLMHKNNYADGIKKLLDSAKSNIEKEIKSQDQKIFQFFLSSCFVISILWFITFLIVRSHFSIRRKMEQNLRSAKEEAEKATQAKSEFLSRMSHELRTPLNAILGFSQLMMMNPNQNIEKRKSNIDHIYQAGSHLLELVDEVLDLSKIESGQFSLTEENLNASLIIKELIAQIQPLAKENKVEIVNHLSQQDDHFVEADHKSFAQIMLNLLSNGIKYNKEDGSIAVDGGVLSKDKIWISVSDNGLGVSNKNIEKLFEPFERLGQEYGEVHGTGIGLSISKSLAELMGGSLSAECELGKGCSFKIVLPVGKREPVNMTTPDSGSATLKIDIQSKSHTILYIEDNRKNLILIEKILETRAQIKFLPAMHPREGIELARTHRPDLILMDMQLPDMDGTAAFRELQKFQETCAIPVIAVSAQAMESDIKKALDIGFKDYITKPIDVPKLLNTIDEVFA